MTAIATATAGMLAAATRLDGAASVLADSLSGPAPSTDPRTPISPAHRAQTNLSVGHLDPVGAVVGQAEALTAFKANVAVFETADRMMKAMLDLKV
jgi:flagellar basal body rod protein FlgC